jgi:hypothetical protein
MLERVVQRPSEPAVGAPGSFVPLAEHFPHLTFVGNPGRYLEFAKEDRSRVPIG